MNQQLAQSEKAIGVDVVFLGDSITERWRETDMGSRKAAAIGSTEVFNDLFSKARGSKYNGLALGISGDTVSTHCKRDGETRGDYILTNVGVEPNTTLSGWIL